MARVQRGTPPGEAGVDAAAYLFAVDEPIKTGEGPLATAFLRDVGLDDAADVDALVLAIASSDVEVRDAPAHDGASTPLAEISAAESSMAARATGEATADPAACPAETAETGAKLADAGVSASAAAPINARQCHAPLQSVPPLPFGPVPEAPPSVPSAAVLLPRPELASGAARLRNLARRAVHLLAYAAGIWACATLILIGVYRFVDPPFSNLMLFQRLMGRGISQEWTPLERISPSLIRAVITAEDGRFCQHFGIDVREVLAAIERARDGVPRGASTISMQVVKNLFLWPSKSYVRKVIELPLTFAIEMAWPKARIFEIYVNVAEWGPGIFGAEAAAHYHFSRPASRLTERQAALLAVALPNPIARNPSRPGRGTARLASIIEVRMRSLAGATSCITRARGVLDGWGASIRRGL